MSGFDTNLPYLSSKWKGTYFHASPLLPMDPHMVILNAASLLMTKIIEQIHLQERQEWLEQILAICILSLQQLGSFLMTHHSSLHERTHGEGELQALSQQITRSWAEASSRHPTIFGTIFFKSMVSRSWNEWKLLKTWKQKWISRASDNVPDQTQWSKMWMFVPYLHWQVHYKWTTHFSNSLIMLYSQQWNMSQIILNESFFWYKFETSPFLRHIQAVKNSSHSLRQSQTICMMCHFI